jgi:hypothetical protein
MSDPSFELGTCDLALIERFDKFVAKNVGTYSLLGCEVTLEAGDGIDQDSDWRRVELTEVTDHYSIYTVYESDGTQIVKEIDSLTQTEQLAAEEGTRRLAVEIELEKILIGTDDYLLAISSYVNALLTRPNPEANTRLERSIREQADGEPDAGTPSASALDILDLLDNLEAVID